MYIVLMIKLVSMSDLQSYNAAITGERCRRESVPPWRHMRRLPCYTFFDARCIRSAKSAPAADCIENLFWFSSLIILES